MMKLLVVTALAISFSAPAVLAGGNNGGKPSDRELAERRCGNNGEGNDAEVLFYTRKGWVCKKNVDLRGEPDEDSRIDVDPN